MYKAIKLILLVVLLSSCKHTKWIRYKNGMKEEESYFRNHLNSTSYTKRGKIVYSDSLNGRIVKVEKYNRQVECFGGYYRKLILITYDSNGKRKERKNLLRVKAKDGQNIRTKF